MTSLTRPPGFYDRTPPEAAAAAAVTNTLQHTMTRFGYQMIETPLVEYADLFLTKAGDEAVNRLFNFELHGRQLCLRPEFTASAARLYIERYQHESKPIRWQFAGPVFRYESPQRSHSRQFTMLGAELIGPSGVSGDAEAMGMAAHGLFSVDVRQWTLEIGHVGLVTQLLDRFDIDRRVRRFLLGHIENLRRPDRGRAYVETQLSRLYTVPSQVDLSQSIQLLLESGDQNRMGRSSADIARRLMNKQQRADQRDELRRALDFLEALAAIEGTPAETFAALDALLVDNLVDEGAIRKTLDEFRATIALLPAYGIAPEQISLQMGLARGLNYYTGIVFEAHTEVGDSSSQLFGGGRYDDFVRLLGASSPTPAIGFAYGLERILHERRRHGHEATAVGVDVLVVPSPDADPAPAVSAAMALRAHLNVELAPTPNLSQALNRANKGGVPYVAIMETTTEPGIIRLTLREMDSGTQFSGDLAEVSDYLSKRLLKVSQP